MQLAATCHAKVTDDVTHMVASAMDADKMHWAKCHNQHRVSVNWLYVPGMNLWQLIPYVKSPVRQSALSTCWQLYHVSRALSGNKLQGLFGSCIICERPFSSCTKCQRPCQAGLVTDCITCQGPFSNCTICQGRCQATNPKGSLIAASSVKGPVRQQAPISFTLEPCAYKLVIGSWHTLPSVSLCVMCSLLCRLCLHCQRVHVKHWFAPDMLSDNEVI